MRARLSLTQIGSAVGGCVVRWLELLGQNPPPARDHGICAWQYLQQRSCPRCAASSRDQDRESFRGIVLADDPHLSLGVGMW